MLSNSSAAPHESRPRVGLALSGGGFRASIFHLGVIRRLEELGIMQDVNVISTVSGGSIIGAYYALEMERRLRERRAELKEIFKDARSSSGYASNECGRLAKIRVEIFEQIQDAFLLAVDRNLRARSLFPFSPFYHPIRFVRSLWPTYSRSDIIQSEFDEAFFHKHPLDQLPSANDGRGPRDGLDGPRLVINATSLLTGERKGFSRVPISGVKEMNKPNSNVLSIARVVGASACVPGLFPPTPILGDLFVDGGVSDNQGLDGLLDDGRWPPGASIMDEDAEKTLNETEDYDAIIVSDASGQLEPKHYIKARASAVLPRTFSIFQHEIRNKITRRLLAWQKGQEWGKAGMFDSKLSRRKGKEREFAYVQLFLNLKERWLRGPDKKPIARVEHRIRSEYIQAAARIRTDLDQFSRIESETLWYHGYTTIDAQLQNYCKGLLENYTNETGELARMSDPPPLFAIRPSTTKGDRVRVDPILRELRAGSETLFLWRTSKKHPTAMVLISLFTLALPMTGAVYALQTTMVAEWMTANLETPLKNWWAGTFPAKVYEWFEWIGGSVTLPVTAKGFLVALAFLLALYVCSWFTFLMARPVARWLDLRRYEALLREGRRTSSPPGTPPAKPTSAPRVP